MTIGVITGVLVVWLAKRWGLAPHEQPRLPPAAMGRRAPVAGTRGMAARVRRDGVGATGAALAATR